MSRKHVLKEIKRIVKEHDVRDPRGALSAIEDVLENEGLRNAVDNEPGQRAIVEVRVSELANGNIATKINGFSNDPDLVDTASGAVKKAAADIARRAVTLQLKSFAASLTPQQEKSDV